MFLSPVNDQESQQLSLSNPYFVSSLPSSPAFTSEHATYEFVFDVLDAINAAVVPAPAFAESVHDYVTGNEGGRAGVGIAAEREEYVAERAGEEQR